MPLAAAGITAFASLMQGLLAAQAQKEQLRKQQEAAAINQGFQSQMQGVQSLSQGQQSAYDKMLQGFSRALG